MRTLTIALETYYLDQGSYPAWSLKKDENAFGPFVVKVPELAAIPTFRMRHTSQLATLTTPISYVSCYFSDNYAPMKGVTFGYWTNADLNTTATGFILWSPGPDGNYDLTIDNVAHAYDPSQGDVMPARIELTYDPSNGATSRGDIIRVKE